MGIRRQVIFTDYCLPSRVASIRPAAVTPSVLGLAIAWGVFAVLGSFALRAHAGIIARAPAVGGVMINIDGVVSAPEVSVQRELQQLRQQSLATVPGDLNAWSDTRCVSLRGLEEAVARHRATNFRGLPDEMKYLAGLQQIRYILVVPERQDIVLVGPAEGWHVDALGNVVGVTSGHPVLLLDDLIVALRTASTGPALMSCSIDPSPDGIQRLRTLVRRMRTIGDPRRTMATIQQALGPQTVAVDGVAPTTHVARVMVAADFRMKRLAMGFEKSPVAELPSYLAMAQTTGSGMSNLMPRWWLAPLYEPLRTDPQGLTWELRGQRVQCLTEQDVVAADGARQQTGRTGDAAGRWAARMTEVYDRLAAKDSAFGLLQNVMDLAVLGALIDREGLLDRAGIALPHLLKDETVDAYFAPREVDTQVSFVQKKRSWIISASGGVQVDPWAIISQMERSDEVATARNTLADAPADSWWWN